MRLMISSLAGLSLRCVVWSNGLVSVGCCNVRRVAPARIAFFVVKEPGTEPTREKNARPQPTSEQS